MRFRLILLIIPALLMLVPPASAELIPIKAQGSAECGMLYVSQAERDAATLDAKRKALDKYISGVKSQNEANRLLSAKGRLFANIDDYVKDVAEITSEKKNGRIYVTIQAAIDRTSLNKFLGDTFKSDSKKAGQKRKKVAFIFVAREVDTVAMVKDHTIDQSAESVRTRTDESREATGKGESSVKAASRGREESDLGYSGSGQQTESRAGSADISVKQSEQGSSKTRAKGQEMESISMRGSMEAKNTNSKSAVMDGQAKGMIQKSGSGEDATNLQARYRESGSSKVSEESAASAQLDAVGARTRNEDVESESARSGSFDGKESFKVNGKSEYSRDYKETKSGRYDTATEQNVNWAGKAREDNSSRSESDTTRNVEKKSTDIRHSEKKTFRVSEYGTANAQLTELFKEQGMRVSESLDGAEIMGQLARAESVNMIRPGDIKKTIAAAKNDAIDFLLIGTVDVGLERNDPATGNILREVLLNANVYDLHGRGLEKAAAVGNLNFSGLGGSPDVAKNNALSTAVKEAAVKLIAQTREYILESAEEE